MKLNYPFRLLNIFFYCIVPVNAMMPVGVSAVQMTSNLPQPYYPHTASYEEYSQMYWDGNHRAAEYQKSGAGYVPGHPENSDSPPFSGLKGDDRGSISLNERQKQSSTPYASPSPSTLSNSLVGRPVERRSKVDGSQQGASGNLLDEFRLNKTRKFELSV